MKKKLLMAHIPYQNFPKIKVALLNLAFSKAKEDGINKVAESPNKGTTTNINTKPTELAADPLDTGIMINIDQYETTRAASAHIKPKIWMLRIYSLKITIQ